MRARPGMCVRQHDLDLAFLLVLFFGEAKKMYEGNGLLLGLDAHNKRKVKAKCINAKNAEYREALL
jgi:hypothetical protein